MSQLDEYFKNHPFRPGYRVAVVGTGAVTPIGNDVLTFWEGLLTQKCGIQKLEFLHPSVRCLVGGLVNFDEEGFRQEEMGPDNKTPQGRAIERAERASLLGLMAVREATKQCRLPRELYEHTGLLIGSNIAAADKVGLAYAQYDENPRSVNALLAMQGMPNATTGVVSIVDGFQGGGFSPASACATGSHAIGQGFLWVNDGVAPVVIAGGCESSFVPPLLASFANVRATTADYNDEPLKASRPFDAKRSGFVPSEGAGVLVLMTVDLAKDLGLPILAELVGYGQSFDAQDMMNPTGEGAAKAIQRALCVANLVAGINAEDVDYVNAHATSTPQGDSAEDAAIKLALGEDKAYQTPVSSIKAQIGHTMGAAGGVESIATIMALRTGILPPTGNLEFPDPECDLDHVSSGPRETNPRVAVKNSFGFGGTNASLVFKGWEE